MKTDQNELIVSTILFEYGKEYDRKEHLDSKIIGFLTFISLILASSIAIFIYLITDIRNIYIVFINLTNFIIVSVLSLSSIILCLFTYKTKESMHVDYKEIWNLYNENNEYVEGTIFKSYYKYLEHNRDKNNETEINICTIYILLKINIFCFIFQLLFLCISFILGGI